MSNPDEKILEDLRQKFEDFQKEFDIDLDVELDDDGTSSFEELEDVIEKYFGNFDDKIQNVMNKKEIKVKKLSKDAVMPSYNYGSDSGFDLYSTIDVEIPAMSRSLVPTGLSVQFPEGYEIQVRTKSGLAINQGLIVLNSPGTIDQGYSGEIKVILFNTNPTPININKGMKIAQAVLCPVVNGGNIYFEEVNSFEETDRGDKGFGSTGI